MDSLAAVNPSMTLIDIIISISPLISLMIVSILVDPSVNLMNTSTFISVFNVLVGLTIAGPDFGGFFR
jgi:hypothetical protein